MDNQLVYFGPKKLEYIGSQLNDLISKDKEKLLAFLNSHKEKLDVFHKHLVLVVLSYKNTFSLSVGFNPEGKLFYGISISNPFLKTPSLYKMKDYSNEELENFYNMLFNLKDIPKVEVGILKFPIQTHFLILGGNKKLISKEMFSEEITGKTWLNFSKLINDETFEKVSNINGGKFGFLKMLLTDDGLYFFGIDEGKYRNLLAEFFTFLKEKYKLESGKYYPISEIKGQVIGSFIIKLGDIFNDKKWELLKKFINDFERFKGFLKELGG